MFSKPDVLSEWKSLQSKSDTEVPVSQHAKPCKPKLSRLGGQDSLTDSSIRWRTPREFCYLESQSVTDMLATQLFFAKLVSERARSKKSMNQTSRAPYNKLVEGTPPRCALRRPSPARYTSPG